MRFTHAALVVALSMWLLVGPALAETGVSDKEILVSTLSMVTGPAEFYGRLTNIGVDCAFNSVNDAGGVYGRRIKCLHPDDKYDADTAITVFNHMLQQGVFGFVALVGSPTMAKYIPMCQSFKVPAVGAYSAPNFTCEPPKRYFFNSRLSYREEMRRIMEKLWTEARARKIAIIYQNDSFGADFLESGRQWLSEHGTEFVAAGSYQRNVNEVKDAVNLVKNANPDAVVIAAVYKPSAEVLKLSKEIGWHPLFALSSGSCIDAMVGEAGTAGDGYPGADVAPPYSRTDLKGIVNYQQAMAKYFPSEKPTLVGLKGYIDALIFVEGLKRAGKDLTRENFVTGLERMRNVDLGLGKGMELTYSPQDHWGLHKVYWITTKNGSVIPFDSWSKLALSK